MVEFRDVVKKYTDPGEALGRDPDTGDVTGLEPGTDVDPVEVVTDPAAQAALSATFAMATPLPTTVPYRVPVVSPLETIAMPTDRVVTCGNISVAEPRVLKAVHLETAVGGDGAAAIEVGIAKMSAAGVLTGQPLMSLGTASATGVGLISIAGLDVELDTGIWGFYALAVGETTTAPQMRAGDPADVAGHSGWGTPVSMIRYAAFITAASHDELPAAVPAMVSGANAAPIIVCEFDAPLV